MYTGEECLVWTDIMAEPSDYTQLWHRMKEDITLAKDDQPTPGHGWFAHLQGGHDAGE